LDSKKQKYVDQYKEDKERYEEEMKQYVPQEGSYEELMTEKKQRKKSSLKKARSAFQFFTDDMKSDEKTFEGLKAGEIMSALTEAWKQVKDTDEGKKFKEMAKKDKKRFDEAKKAKDEKDEEKSPSKQTSKKKEKVEEKKKDNDDLDDDLASESSGSESESDEEKEVVPVKQQKSGKRKSGSK